MTDIITTSLTVTRQRMTKLGDSSLVPVVFVDKQEFDEAEEADDFVEHLNLWASEYPKPNGNFHPFRRVKTPATEERLTEILDDMHGPDDLWVVA